MRTGKAESDDLLFGLVLLVAALNLLLPGETWYQSRALSQLLVFAGFGALLLTRRPDAVCRGAAARALRFGCFLLLLVPSLCYSVCPGRSLETLALWAAYVAFYLLIRGLRPERRHRELAVTVVGLVTVLLLLYGLYQYVTEFGGLAKQIAADPSLTEGQRADMLSRLASRRVFSTFPLPTTFAELIVIALPLMLHRVRAALRRHRAAAAGWAAAALLGLVVLTLTGSYGALPVLAALGFVALLARSSRWTPRRRAAAGGVAVLLAAAAFLVVFQVRGFTPWDAEQAHNPVRQRLFNWRAAAAAWQEHPLAGVGPGNFQVAYARHRPAGANETVVAHNTYLHLAAEGGTLPAVALAALALLLGWRILRRLSTAAGGGDGAGRAVGYAALALLLYGCFEITVEYPGIGYPGLLLIALAAAWSSPAVHPVARSEDRGASGMSVVSLEPAGAVVLALLLTAGFLWTGCWYLGRGHLERAILLTGEGAPARDEALDAARRAAAWNPLDPEPPAVRGALLLAAGAETGDPRLARRAATAFAAASALDPERAFFHHRLSVAHEAAGEGLSALVQAEKAFRLYPSQPRYRDRRAALIRQLEEVP